MRTRSVDQAVSHVPSPFQSQHSSSAPGAVSASVDAEPSTVTTPSPSTVAVKAAIGSSLRTTRSATADQPAAPLESTARAWSVIVEPVAASAGTV